MANPEKEFTIEGLLFLKIKNFNVGRKRRNKTLIPT
jgi:hypothetical protein